MRSTAEGEFRDFVIACRHRLRRTSYLLTGDHAEAERLTDAALVRTRRHWRRVTREESPERYALGVLVKLRTSRFWRWRERRRQRLSVNVGGAGDDQGRHLSQTAVATTGRREPDPAGAAGAIGAAGVADPADAAGAASADAADAAESAAWEALRDLPARRRTVLALRLYEDLPETEIAATLGCSEQTAVAEETRGMNQVRAALERRDRPAPVTDRGETAPQGNAADDGAADEGGADPEPGDAEPGEASLRRRGPL